ncbi:MAG: NAD(+) synthase [Bacteroidota bacterium]|jgi:NAD+ synthase
MNYSAITSHIVNWLKEYAKKSNVNGFVIGISGGIDSAVTSTLCALTGKQVLTLNMPIRQAPQQFNRSSEHINWLKTNFNNVSSQVVDLTSPFNALEATFPPELVKDVLSMGNTRARLRMTTLYAFACTNKLLVAGTGNKVEDFGIGFYTKYGDGGVDLSPIADLYKTEVYALGKHLNITESILTARPTDGLFDDGRTDEDQIMATYPELEWTMEYIAQNKTQELTARQKEVMEIYSKRNKANQHKMLPIPVCEIPNEVKYHGAQN